MATLLNGVNELLKRAKLIQGDSGTLTSLTDSSRQVFIDTAVQALNDVVEELYSITSRSKPNQLAENTITLVTSDRDYALQSDLEVLKWPLIDETNGRRIFEFEGGYEQLVASQPFPSSYTGIPIYGAIRPTDGQLYLDRVPTSAENGLVYKYRYDKDVSLSAASDTFPFTDVVYRAIIPAAVEVFNRYHKQEFNDAFYNVFMARAARKLSRTPARESYRPSKIYQTSQSGVAFPFD